VSELDDLRKQVCDLTARVEALEANLNRVQPWLATIYEDMLTLQLAASADMRGDKDEALRLVGGVKQSYALLAGTKVLDDE
jgi:hypothetical protein